MMIKTIRSQSGSVLIASTIVTMLLLAIVVQYCFWVNQNTKKTVHRVASYKALVNADSGLQAALQYLRSPKSAELEPGVPKSVQSMSEGTTFYLTFTRQVADKSLVDIASTGYFYLANGAYEDGNYRRSQMGAIQARVQLRNVGEFFAATPGTLTISYGSNISSGVVYGRDLVFETGTVPPLTRLRGAAYSNSVTPSNLVPYVSFADPAQPQRYSIEPQLPVLNLNMRNLYQLLAGPEILAPNSTVSGLMGAPMGNPYKVYFSAGDVYIGTPAELTTVTSSFLIYAQGNIYIQNKLVSQISSTAWPALMAEGNIHIAANAPDSMEINATMVTNGVFKAIEPSRPAGTLRFVGGIITGSGIFVGDVFTGGRDYVYQAPDPLLPLPFTTQLINYQVTKGKYL